jgi:HTH-type transcriptional regulator/antitoxin HigA
MQSPSTEAAQRREEKFFEAKAHRSWAEELEVTMAVPSIARTMPATYFELVKRFPLTHIRSNEHLAVATEMIDQLLQEELDEGAQEYLDALTDLVEVYEDEHVLIPDASEADVLRELMRANGYTQPVLAKKVGIAQSTISEVLNGARALTKKQVIKLAKVFGVSPAVFLPA